MSFFSMSDGTQAQAEAEYELPSGNLEPIPEGSSVLAIIDEAKWANDKSSGLYYVSLRWSVLQPDAFKNRKIFQKLWIDDLDPRKTDPAKAKQAKDRAIRMFMAIDHNCGGALLKAGGKPTDEAMIINLTNKPMVIRLGEYALEGEKGDALRGNYVQAVAGPNKGINITNAKPAVAKAAPALGGGQSFASSLDDDLPF